MKPLAAVTKTFRIGATYALEWLGFCLVHVSDAVSGHPNFQQLPDTPFTIATFTFTYVSTFAFRRLAFDQQSGTAFLCELCVNAVVISAATLRRGRSSALMSAVLATATGMNLLCIALTHLPWLTGSSGLVFDLIAAPMYLQCRNSFEKLPSDFRASGYMRNVTPQTQLTNWC